MTETGYLRIKEIAKELRCVVTDLLVLARQNDPFYAGVPAQERKARWFAGLWERFGYTTGVHLRRVHYRVVSQVEPRKDDGSPYQNTEGCWSYLGEAAKAARYLGYVRADAFVDRRNPDPHLLAPGVRTTPEPSWWAGELNASLPTVPWSLDGALELHLPGAYAMGYEYEPGHQPYHVELWVEKSTMDDVLIPVCRELGVNLVTSLGFQSITSVIELIRRIVETEKPARILYISDFDPAGDGMPTAVARQLEYWLWQYASGADVALTPVALTREQVEQYRLPRIPVKDSDRRKASFEGRYGEGAVELDALEALQPGELARVVREAVAPYRDGDLNWRLYEASRRARDEVDAVWGQATAPFQAELDAIEGEAAPIVARYQARLDRLRDEMAAELGPPEERLEGVRQAIRNEALSLTVELPVRPEAEALGVDEGDWLFRSDRDYLEQLTVYKRRNGCGTGGLDDAAA
jgi:hypothetical protein